MCEPVSLSIIMASAAAAQQGGNFMQAKEAHRFARARHELNKTAANRAANDMYADLITQQRQVQQRAAQEGAEAFRESRMASAAMSGEAAAAGVMGGSLQDIESTFSVRYAESAGARLQNMRATQQQMMRDMAQVRAQQEQRILSTSPGPSPRFNWLSTLGSVAGAAGSGYAMGGGFSSGGGSAGGAT